MDKIKQLYDSFLSNNIISSNTDFETFKSANEEQLKTLYNSAVKNKVLSTATDFNMFSSAWDLKKKDDLQPTVQEDATVSATVEEPQPILSEPLENPYVQKINEFNLQALSDDGLNEFKRNVNFGVTPPKNRTEANIQSDLPTDEYGVKYDPSQRFRLVTDPDGKLVSIDSRDNVLAEAIDIYQKAKKPIEIDNGISEDYVPTIATDKLNEVNVNINDYAAWEKKNVRQETGGYKFFKNLITSDEGALFEKEQSEYQKLSAYQADKLTKIANALETSEAKAKLATNTKDRDEAISLSNNLKQRYIEETKKIQSLIDNFPKLKELSSDRKQRLKMYNDMMMGEAIGGVTGTGVKAASLGRNTVKSVANTVADFAMNTMAAIPAFIDASLGGDKGVLAGITDMFLDSSEHFAQGTKAVNRPTFLSGKEVRHNGRDYIVSEDGNIYDKDSHILVSDIIDENTANKVKELSKDLKVETNFSPGAGVEGTGAQIANLFALIKGSGIIKNATGLSGGASMGVASYASQMAGTVDEIKGQLLDVGLSEQEATEKAFYYGNAIASLDGVFSGLAGSNEKLIPAVSTIKQGIIDLAKTEGKDFTKKQFKDKVKDLVNENLKEVFIEELPVLFSEKAISGMLNKSLGINVRTDKATKEDILETIFLTVGATSALGSTRLISNTSRDQMLNYISQQTTEYEKISNNLVNQGLITKEEANSVVNELNRYRKADGDVGGTIQIPANKLEASDLISKKKELVEKASGLDPSLRGDIDAQIQEIDEKIKQIKEKDKKDIQDAIQEQKTRDIPDVERAEGVQEVETEVRLTDKKAEKVSDLLNRPVTLTELGGSKLDAPIEGDMYVDGQQVVVEDANGNITEIGNVDEVSGKTLTEMGISQQESNVKTDTQGNLVVGEDTLVPDKGGIKRNKRGDITSVTLRTPDGSITRTLRGVDAEEAAYQILLKEAQSPEQVETINQLLEQDEEFQNELREATAAAETETVADTEQADRAKNYAEELKKTKDSDPSSYWSVDTVTEEDASKGTVIDTEDGAAVVGPDGDIKGVFKKLTSKAKGVAQTLLKKAIEAGGTKLDNFVTGANGVKLQEIYEKAGFRVVSRTPFNEKFAPEGWTEKDGRPDVVAMVYDPDKKLDIKEKMFDNPKTGYKEMIAYRDKVLEGKVDGVAKLRDIFSKRTKGLDTQIENARKALSKIAPDVKIILHESEQAYAEATNEQNLSQKTAGEYNPNTNTIHINPEKANNRTVAHETFHAIFINSVKSDAETQRLASAMIKSVYKSAPDRLKRLIDEFATSKNADGSNNYDEAVQNEERLAELIGYIATDYDSLPTPTKGVIKRFLDRLAKMFGLKPFTDNEVIELLNTISGKISSGQEITTDDINIIESEQGMSGAVGVFKMPTKKAVKAPLISEDTRDFANLIEQVDIREFEGQPFISNMYDYTTAGKVDLGNGLSITLFGGKNYVPYMMKLKNLSIGDVSNLAAFNTKAQAETFIRNSVQGKANLFAPHAGGLATSWQFQQKIFEEFMNLIIDNKLVSKSSLIESFNKGLKDTKGNFISPFEVFRRKLNKNIRNLSGFKANPKELVELLSIEKNFSPDLRKRLVDILISNKDFQKAIGIKNKNDLYNLIMDPMNKGVVGGEIIGIIKFDPNTFEIKKTKKGDIDHHESFGYTLLAKIEGIYQPTEFHKSYDITDSFTKYNKDETLVSTKENPNFIQSNVLSSAGSIPKVGVFKNVSKQQLGRPSIAEVRDVAEKNNISEVDTNKYLKELGYTDAEIFGKQVITAEELIDSSESAIKEKLKRRTLNETLRYLRKKIFDRQTYIKDVLKGIGSKESVRAHNRLVTKAGAKGWANFRYKKAEKEIYSGLSEQETKSLNALIYARRIVAINENRQKRGLNPYIGAKGYNYASAKADVSRISNEKLSKRADKYFEVYNENLKRLKDSGRISEEVYDNLKDVEYSPIKTIKYILGDNHNVNDINELASSIGMTQKDIMTLSDENINDTIMDSRWLLMMNINAIENRAATNEVLNLFYDALQSATNQEIEGVKDNILVNPIVGTKKSGAPKFKYDEVSVPVGYKTVSFFKNGVEHKMVMKEEYARQLIDARPSDKVIKKVREFTFGNVLRFFATSGNPMFVFGNTAVDFQNILFLSDTYSSFKLAGGIELGYDFVKNSLKKMANTNSYKSTLEEFMRYGGGMDFLSVDGIKAVKGLRRFNKPRTVAQKALVKWGNFWSYAGETSELAFRLAVYEKTKSNLIKDYKNKNKKEPTGQDLEDILYQSTRESRETIDFSQGGDLIKSADYALPYLNASVQGVRKAVDYASKNPVGFTSNMIQYAAMSGGLFAGSIYMLMSAFSGDDDEEKANKIKEAWGSVSEYEKSAYHIVFTGKTNEEGEYEYKRFKKLPVIGILSTVVEEAIMNQLLESNGVDYKFDTKSISMALDKTSPIGVTDITSRNPVVSGALSYYYNKDTFTGEEIFKGPRNKKILPEVEGIYDNKVEQIYKDIAPMLGMSPKRSQVMIEKVITNERTNPIVGIMYGAYNGVFSNETTVGEEMLNTGKRVLESMDKKMTRYTNKDLKSFKMMEEEENMERVIETEIYKKEQKVYNQIKKMRENGEDITTGDLKDIVTENFDKIDWEKYGRKFSTYSRNANISRSLLDLIYEDTPEVQAYMLFNRYGNSFDDEEQKELKEVMNASRRRLSKKALYIYNKKYKNATNK